MTTVLSAGDLAIIGINADNPDAFSFVLLTDIEAGTEIFFTDNGVFSDGSFRQNEGIVKYTASADISAGTVIEFTGITGDFTTEDAGFDLSVSGDQVIAYQGTVDSPTFIYAAQTNSTEFQTGSDDAQQSDLPPGLTVGETAVAVGAGAGAESEFDNSTYNESVTSGTKAELLAAISDAANWVGSNTLITELANGPFSVDGAVIPTVGELLITEIADPNNNAGARYVELYAFGGDVDLTGLQLVRWTNGNADFTASTAIDLENLGTDATLAEGEFLVIANNGAEFSTVYGFTADLSAGIAGPADSNGDDQIGIIDANGNLLDIFGVPGEDGTGTDHEFEDGRAERQATATAASATWNAADWNIDNDGGAGDGPVDAPDGFDPGAWIGATGGNDGTRLAIAPTDANQAEGDTGTTAFTFTITRSGDTSGAIDVDYTVSGDADAADFGGTLPAGTVSFAAGETTQIVTVNVSGDTDIEASESFTVTLSNPTGGATITTATANGTIQNDDVVLTPISEIQGSGFVSPLDDETVSTSGIVTKLLSNGFYIQTPDGMDDGNATTSEGLWIFTGSAPTVTVGDAVEITGEAGEFFGLTQLSADDITVESSGNILPTAVQITLPDLEQADLEAYEGMRFELVSSGAEPLVIIENFNFDRFGEITVAEGNQIQPTQIFDPATQQAEIQALTSSNTNERLLLDDGVGSQNPDEFAYVPANVGDNGNGFLDAGDTFSAAGPTARLGAEVSDIKGVLSFGFSEYRLLVDDTITIDPATNEGARPAEAPEVGGDLSVASFNVLNYFTTIDVSGAGSGPNNLNPRGADTASELERQTAKLVAALAELDADVVGLQEIENNGIVAVSTLVDELNAFIGADVYDYVDPTGTGDFIGTDAIATGLIYKPSEVSVVAADVLVFEEASAATTFALADVLNAFASSDDQVGDFQRNRPAVAATFQDVDSGEQFTVAVNHFKSKGDSNLQDVVQDAQFAGAPQAAIDALLADPNYDQGDGQGFWNQVRADAGAELAAWLTDSSANGYAGGTIADPDFIALGDLNAYAQEDPVNAVEAGGFTDLIDAFAPGGQAEAYSFVFDGQRGSLDHALGTSSLASQVTGVAEWHINADEPDLLNYDESFNNSAFFDANLFGASDHDPLLIGLDLTSPLNEVRGTRKSDKLTGTDGRDRIEGRNGRDIIDGLAGNDIIIGGRGDDKLTGGANQDVFVYKSVRDGKDTILDFEVTLDTIDLSDLFNSRRFGSDSPFEDYIRIEDSTKGARLIVDGNGDRGNFVETTLAVFEGITASDLTAANFAV